MPMKQKIRKPPSPLRILRARTGLTLREAGALVGRSGQSVLNWEKGDFAPPEELRKYRKALREIRKSGA